MTIDTLPRREREIYELLSSAGEANGLSIEIARFFLENRKIHQLPVYRRTDTPPPGLTA